VKPDAPTGALCLEPDADGNWWLSGMFQTGRGEVSTSQKEDVSGIFPLPKEDEHRTRPQQSMVMPRGDRRSTAKGVVERGQQAVHPQARSRERGSTSSSDVFQVPPREPRLPYGLATDAANNLFFMDFGRRGDRPDRRQRPARRASIRRRPKRSRPRRTMMDAGRARSGSPNSPQTRWRCSIRRRRPSAEWESAPPRTPIPTNVFVDRNGEAVERIDVGRTASCASIPKTGASVE